MDIFLESNDRPTHTLDCLDGVTQSLYKRSGLNCLKWVKGSLPIYLHLIRLEHFFFLESKLVQKLKHIYDDET